jgi:hypothetical protein
MSPHELHLDWKNKINVSEMKQLPQSLEKNWLEVQSELRRLKAALEEIAEGSECRECGV